MFHDAEYQIRDVTPRGTIGRGALAPYMYTGDYNGGETTKGNEWHCYTQMGRFRCRPGSMRILQKRWTPRTTSAARSRGRSTGFCLDRRGWGDVKSFNVITVHTLERLHGLFIGSPF